MCVAKSFLFSKVNKCLNFRFKLVIAHIFIYVCYNDKIVRNDCNRYLSHDESHAVTMRFFYLNANYWIDNENIVYFKYYF